VPKAQAAQRKSPVARLNAAGLFGVEEVVSQAGFEPATFPLGGLSKPQQLLTKPRIYWAFRPVVSVKTTPYSSFCTHHAPMGTN